MKVLVIVGPLEFLRELATVPGLELTVLAPDSSSAWLEREIPGCRALPYDPRAKLHPAAIWQVRRAITTVRPDVVHAFYGRPLCHTVLATVGLAARPAIISFRGITGAVSRFDMSNLISYRHRRVDGHACESDAVRASMIASGIAAEKCVTIYNCVRAAGWAAPGRHGLEPWGLGDEVFVVGTVASMRPVKGIDLLLQAALACPDLPDIRWLLIGPIRDPRVQQLVDDPRLRERVRWLGYRPDARELISGADLFVMPSRQEALCVALLEAMAQGVCPVVSDAGGMREVVRDGEDGVVVPRENVAALANAIRALHADRDRVRRLAASARQRVTDFCSPARMVARALELYRRFAA